MPTTESSLPTVLTIAGFDPSGGAGIQADLKTIHALGGYGLSVTTVLTSQNTQGVSDTFAVPADVVKGQLEALSEDIKIDAIKIGMLGNADMIDVVANWLEQQQPLPVILDPVIQSSSGKLLLNSTAMSQLKQRLLQQTELITPNLPELEKLLEQPIDSVKTNLAHIQQMLLERNWPNTLLKGGHTEEEQAVDYLFHKQTELKTYASKRLSVQHNHGTGCTLSSAIATYRAFGYPLTEAVENAKAYLFKALELSGKSQPGFVELQGELENRADQRHGGLNHFWDQKS